MRFPRARVAALLLALVSVFGASAEQCAGAQAAGSPTAHPHATPTRHPAARRASPARAIRCDGRLSCSVDLSRSTTQLLARRVTDGTTRDAVISIAAGEAACLLLTDHLMTHVLCTVGASVGIYGLTQALREAKSNDGCLQLVLRAPRDRGTWSPVSAGTDTTGRCRG